MIKCIKKKAENYLRRNLKAVLEPRKNMKTLPNEHLQFVLDANGEKEIESIIADVLIFFRSSFVIITTLF